MKKPRPAPTNRIAAIRKEKGLTQQQLADAVGSHWITISKLERGVMRLSDEWRKAIAECLQVDEWDLVPGGRKLPVAHIAGMVDEGGRVVGLDEENSEAFQISTSMFTHPAFRWLVVAGDALWPWYQDGDRLCLWQIDGDELESVVGRPCYVVYETSGEPEGLMGTYEGRDDNGRYTIGRFNAPPLRNLRLISVEVVAMAVYYLGPKTIHESDSFVPLDTGPVF